MADFSYQGRNKQGALVKGVLQGNSTDMVASELLRLGVTPIRINESQDAAKSLAIADRFPVFKTKISLDDLVIFCRQMHALTRAGIPITSAIRGLADSAKNESFREVLLDVAQRLESGVNLATAMSAHPATFNKLFVSMIMVGENTGELEGSFRQLGSNIEFERDTRKRVSQATRYPLMVVAAMTIALLIVNFFVIPAFAGVFAKFGAELPLPTKILLASSSFLLTYGWAVAVFVVLAIVAFVRWKKTAQGQYQWDSLKLRIPLTGPLFELVALSRFSRNFSMMLAAGLPITTALTLVAEALNNHYIGKAVADMRMGIERGDTLLRTARASGMFSPLVMQMLAVGEETGSVDSLLKDVADFYDEEVEYSLKKLAESIEPILLVFMGGMVLILALGVFLPMWDLGAAALGRG